LLLACLSCTAAQAADGSDYRLGAGDVIRISVFGYPDQTAELRVSESGSVTYPLIGAVTVKGLSPHDVEGAVTKRLESGGFFRKPQVSVLVLQFESQKISVMGQVTKPGQYPLQASSRVLDFLAAAGGVVNTVAGDGATLLRKDGSKVEIDLLAMFEGDPAQNPAVQAGDTIYVSKASQFYVYGEVQHPGVYRLERNMTVSRAIAAGGGLTPRGTERSPLIKRRDTAGKESEVKVDGADRLQPDDVLFIQESWF